MAKGSARARVAALVRRLAPGGSAAEQAEAAHALARLCFDKGPLREHVRRCGGITALDMLLAPGSSAAVHEQAAVALHNLCVECSPAVHACSPAVFFHCASGPGGGTGRFLRIGSQQ